MLKYYAGGSIILIFLIIGIFIKSNTPKEKKIKQDDIELKNTEINDYEDFTNWGQFIYIDE